MSAAAQVTRGDRQAQRSLALCQRSLPNGRDPARGSGTRAGAVAGGVERDRGNAARRKPLLLGFRLQLVESADRRFQPFAHDPAGPFQMTFPASPDRVRRCGVVKIQDRVSALHPANTMGICIEEFGIDGEVLPVII